MSAGPEVSVIMAAYNAVRFINDAVGSVLAQDFPALELIVVDDGSGDGTGDRLVALAARDVRMRVVRQDNAGMAAARNAALALARAPLIAVADADDIQLPGRIGRLWSRFQQAPGVDICGGGVEPWDEVSGPAGAHCMPETDERIRAGMLFESQFFDPTVMYRREVVLAARPAGYDPSFRMAVDYDLWSRVMDGSRLANLPEVLTRYRRHGGQATVTEARTGRSREERRRVWRRLLSRAWGLEPGEEELAAHERVAGWAGAASAGQREQARGWLERLLEWQRRRPFFPVGALEEQLARRWLWVCRHSEGGGFRVWRRSPLSRCAPVPLRSRLALLRAGAAVG